MKRSIILFIYSFIALQLHAQREVYWLHGLGDDRDKWGLYAGLMQQEFLLNSHNNDYNEINGLALGEASFRAIYGPVTNDRILIGHSLGGLIARQHGINNTDVAGIVTVGTSNSGALVIPNIENGQVRAALNTAVDHLSAGLLADPLFWVVAPIVSIMTPEAISNVIWGYLDDFFTGLQNLQSYDDLTPGSPALDNLERSNVPADIINVVCREDGGDAPLRLAAATENEPALSPLHSFSDTKYVSKKNSMANYYQAAKNYYNVKKYLSILLYPYYNNKAKQWAKGETYLKTRYLQDWNAMIGAYRTEQYTTVEREWGCDLKTMKGDDEVIAECGWRDVTVTRTRTVSEESDGLLPLSTQIIEGTSSTRIFYADGVSHNEVGNHESMTEIFRDDIFGSRTNLNFQVPPR